jgi:hypothetical protein
MASVLRMRSIGGVTSEKPTMAKPSQDRVISRNVRVLAERRDSNIVVGPQSANVRELATVGGGGLTR